LNTNGVQEQKFLIKQDSHPNLFMIKKEKVKFRPASCKSNLILSHEETIFSSSHPSQTWMLQHLMWMLAPASWSSQDV
jgi:hypothetical protein